MLKKTLTIALLAGTIFSAGACSTESSTNLDYTVDDSARYVCTSEAAGDAEPIWECDSNN